VIGLMEYGLFKNFTNLLLPISRNLYLEGLRSRFALNVLLDAGEMNPLLPESNN